MFRCHTCLRNALSIVNSFVLQVVLSNCCWSFLALFDFECQLSSSAYYMYIQILHKYGKVNGVCYVI